MTTTYEQDSKFINDIVGVNILEEVVGWIKSNMNPEDVFDEEDLRFWAIENVKVDEYDEEDLRDWANENGYSNSLPEF
jgi:hypothetical protein